MCFSPIVVYATTLMGLMIVVGAGLSFLGLGVQPPVADWGTMVADGRVVLRRAPHVTVAAGRRDPHRVARVQLPR